MSTCVRCGKKHEGKCLTNMDGCFSFSKSGLKIRDFSMIMANGRDDIEAFSSGSGFNAPKQNRFYALQTHGE